MDEVRYAVIIGINDYDGNPLRFCVNDANSVKSIIQDKANFQNEEIYLITSDIDSTIKDITGKLLEAVMKIKQNFNKGKDTIFFYFAGHGFQDDGQSYLMFQDSKYPISEVYNLFKDLSPKMQFYVIDACESGNKTLTRSVYSEEKNIIKELIENSSGILFLYACQANQSAKEDKTIEHGIMTNYFLKAIGNSELYDEDGILTPGRIQEYVAKNVGKYSGFSQIPVVENNISGYYPFAMLSPNFENKILEIGEINRGEIGMITFNQQSRLELQRLSFDFLNKAFDKFITTYFKDYKIKYFDRIEDMKLLNIKKLLMRITEDAAGRYTSIKNTIFIVKEPIYETSISTLGSMGSLLGFPNNRKIIDYENKPKIEYNSDYLDSFNVLVSSPDIWKVSLGLGVVTYQAKWGGVISPYFYRVEWDGESDNTIEDIQSYHYTYLIEQSSFEQIPTMELDFFKDIITYNDNWNKNRNAELEGFKIKPSSKIDSRMG